MASSNDAFPRGAATVGALACFASAAWLYRRYASDDASNARSEERKAVAAILRLAEEHGLDVRGGQVRRSSSRFCLGVEHGDYNGTELFGVGTDRFIWIAFKRNGTDRVRIASTNFPGDGLIDFALSDGAAAFPPPRSPAMRDTWARFPWGVVHVLRQRGFGAGLTRGFDAVVHGNIPGGGMSRSASLTLNLLLTTMQVNGLDPDDPSRSNAGLDADALAAADAACALARKAASSRTETERGAAAAVRAVAGREGDAALRTLQLAERAAKKSFEVVRMAQAVENDYVGSPCGMLDQIMIYYAFEGAGTRYSPATGRVEHVLLGAAAEARGFALVALDTGTDRPGLEKSTYVVRRRECDALARLLAAHPSLVGLGMKTLADVDTDEKAEAVRAALLGTKILEPLEPLEPSAPSAAAPQDAAAEDLSASATLGVRSVEEADERARMLRRLGYIRAAKGRFAAMLRAWREGDLAEVGRLFRADGIGLRDDYDISGPHLETMCDVARTVEGVAGERMLGGGDRGAAGAIVVGPPYAPWGGAWGASRAVARLRRAVATAYPRAHPEYGDRWAVHELRLTDGIALLDGLV
jgi:galactokinase